MPIHFPRRVFLRLLAFTSIAIFNKSKAQSSFALQDTGSSAIGQDGTNILSEQAVVQLHWNGSECHPTVTNLGSTPLPIREVVILDYRHSLPPDTAVYGESFQMLTQTSGTLASPHEIGYSEQGHYRIPGPTDAAVVTNLLTLSPPGRPHLLLAYTSSHRFSGRFYLRPGRISVVVDTENLVLAPGESWQLEGFLLVEGNDRNALLRRLADTLNKNHPHTMFPAPPTGWCSWYCFARQTTAQEVVANLGVIRQKIPALRYIQIDDGYQPAMGDWLLPGPSFGGHVQDVLLDIRLKGFQPAIWVAPFIAGTHSQVLQEHPEWFVQTAEGHPMPAADVTFTGWGEGGWYCLDGTHPEVQQHLEHVFRVMRKTWGCTYFKLDANFWGAVHGGRFHDPRATRIEAYRRGMQAIRRGAGDAFLLGCNHPIWPSLGLIDGSRSSGDISRSWKTVRECMEQSMQRNWQNSLLWWNDPDAVLLADRRSGEMQGSLTEEEFRFHATSAFASGGLTLSGDDLTSIPPDRLRMLRELLPPTGSAATFDDAATLQVGRIQSQRGSYIAVFNRMDTARAHTVPLPGRWRVVEVWTGEQLGVHAGDYHLVVPAHAARLLLCTPVSLPVPDKASGGFEQVRHPSRVRDIL